MIENLKPKTSESKFDSPHVESVEKIDFLQGMALLDI